MTQLGLKEVNNAVFLKSDTETIKKLLLLQHYIAFGYPTKKIVNDLVRKRGFLKKENKREPLQNNALIEELLGEHGVICVEDIIECLIKCSDEEMPFEQVKKTLWPI